MKKILFLLSATLLLSCETEFEVNADWQELMVVHGILDQSQGEQFVRINKAFLGEQDALVMASISDSSNYNPSDLLVRLINMRMMTSSSFYYELLDSIDLVDTIMPKDNGEFYTDDKKLGADLGNALNQEILSLVEAGCQYIQVDEPVFARKPEKALEYGVENLERCFDGVPDHVTRAMHACCGYPNALDTDNYYKAPPKSYFDIAEAIDKSSINAISIEDAHRPNDPKLLELFQNTTVMMGLVDVAKSKLEEVDQVKERIKLCLEHIDRERFIAAPDLSLIHI